MAGGSCGAAAAAVAAVRRGRRGGSRLRPLQPPSKTSRGALAAGDAGGCLESCGRSRRESTAVRLRNGQRLFEWLPIQQRVAWQLHKKLWRQG